MSEYHREIIAANFQIVIKRAARDCLVTPFSRIAECLVSYRHNGLDSVSNHQHHDCLLKRLFRRRSKKTSKLHVTGLCAGNLPETGEFPTQRASNTKNVWWRHHEAGPSDALIVKQELNVCTQFRVYISIQHFWGRWRTHLATEPFSGSFGYLRVQIA